MLLYGPDAGWCASAPTQLARSVCPDLKDPFRVADLSAAALAADPARLADEAAQLSLIGGRRVVRVRDAGDRARAIVRRFLATASGDALIVVEAGDLPQPLGVAPRLREAATAARDRLLPRQRRATSPAVIRETFAAHRVTASAATPAQFLVEHLGGDRLLTRSELEKLALYAGDGGADRARRCAARRSATAPRSSSTTRSWPPPRATRPGVDRALARVFQEGESPVIDRSRALLRHLQRLHVLAARLAAGDSDRRGDPRRPPADLLQAGGQLPPPARAVERGAAAGRSSTASPRPSST